MKMTTVQFLEHCEKFNELEYSKDAVVRIAATLEKFGFKIEGKPAEEPHFWNYGGLSKKSFFANYEQDEIHVSVFVGKRCPEKTGIFRWFVYDKQAKKYLKVMK